MKIFSGLLITLAVGMLGAFLCRSLEAQTGGGSSVTQAITNISIGNGTVCTSSFTAGNLRLIRVGSQVTAWMTSDMTCNLTSAASFISFAALLPTALQPPAGSTVRCMGPMILNSGGSTGVLGIAAGGAVSFSVVSGTFTTWASEGNSCSYSLR